jgi:site-specific DNA-methyltransferase (adenine-specific)
MTEVKINDKITLYNADCMEVMREYPDGYFDLAVVDPDYGLNGKISKG